MNTEEAARELKLGLRTVESHRSKLMEKLGLSNVVELVHLAFQLGIVRTDH
jgi:DNA-binding NarL/FixJ family response regulator